MENQKLLQHRSPELRSPSGLRSRDEESGQRTARQEMVLRVFNYMEPIASAPWIYSKCAG